MIDEHGIEMVQVLLRFPNGAVPEWEAVRATPVHVDDDGGGANYVVRNNAYLANIRFGDIVHTEVDADSYLQVTGIVHLHEGPLTAVQHPDTVPADQVAAVTDAWDGRGAMYTEAFWEGALLTAWSESLSAAMVVHTLEETAPPGWVLLDIVTAAERAAHLMGELNFDLDRV